jgi:hypothetical protein
MTHEEILELIERLHQALEQQRISKAFENREIMDGKLAEDVLFMIRDSAFAIRHLLQAQTWRPISEAPKDGTPVDLWITPPKGMITGTGPTRSPDCWYSGGKWWRYDELHGDDQCRMEVHNATHWMHLPQPPSSFEERGSATPSDQQNEGEA